MFPYPHTCSVPCGVALTLCLLPASPDPTNTISNLPAEVISECRANLIQMKLLTGGGVGWGGGGVGGGGEAARSGQTSCVQVSRDGKV